MRIRDVAVACCSSLVLALACGGSTPPPEAPATAAAESTPPEAVEGAAPSAEKPVGASTPLNDDDTRAILQLVVDDPELDHYLHLGEPGRFPLQLAGEQLPSGLKLVKSTEPVKIVEGAKSKKDAVLVVTELTAEGDKATVRYRYDVEGIRATVTLAKSAHGWELKNSRLVEH